MRDDSHEFEHFVKAQASVYSQVLVELAGGCKYSHWMWFIFPQLRGLGHSMMSECYAIDDLAQAKRYLVHGLLGLRLHECTKLVSHVQSRTADDIFGYPDCMKFRSSMTLFSLCCPPGNIFSQALGKYYAGEPDYRTLQLLNLDTGTRNQSARPALRADAVGPPNAEEST